MTDGGEHPMQDRHATHDISLPLRLGRQMVTQKSLDHPTQTIPESLRLCMQQRRKSQMFFYLQGCRAGTGPLRGACARHSNTLPPSWGHRALSEAPPDPCLGDSPLADTHWLEESLLHVLGLVSHHSCGLCGSAPKGPGLIYLCSLQIQGTGLMPMSSYGLTCPSPTWTSGMEAVIH